MRGVLIDVPDSLIAERKRLGLDRYDEMWEGVLHMAATPRVPHQRLVAILAHALFDAAEADGLHVTDGLNVCHPERLTNDYRIPDLLVIEPDPRWSVGDEFGVSGGIALAVEIRSPRDEAYEKVPFYAERGVRRLVVIDEPAHIVVRYDLGDDGTYTSVTSQGPVDIGFGVSVSIDAEGSVVVTGEAGELARMIVPTGSRVGFLGPLGTFTEQAVMTQPDLAGCEKVLYRTMPDVLDAVGAGEVEVGFVAIENSIEGTVNLTQDELAFSHDLLIQREVVLDIEHCLMAPAGTAIHDVKVVVSIPVATAQCHTFLRRQLPDADLHAANSTAEAARALGASTAPGCAAIAPRIAAEMYGLNILAADIGDHPGNQTRFVLVARTGIPAPTGHDRTGLVVFQRADEPGSLISILQEFAARRINLSNLLSRPTKDGGLGDYCFVIYADGHISDELMADAVRALHAKQGRVKFLGSYPAAGEHAHTTREHADERWRQADDWLRALRSQIEG